MNNTVAELEAKLALATGLREKIDLTLDLGFALRFSDPQRALALCSDLRDLCHQGEYGEHAYHPGLARTALLEGTLNVDSTHYEEAFRALKVALTLYRELEDRRNVAVVLNLIGMAHLAISDYAEALQCYLEGSEYVRQRGDLLEAGFLNNVAFTFVSMQDFESALPYAQRAFQIARERQDRQGKVCQAFVLDTLCQTYAGLQEVETALQYGKASRAICTENQLWPHLAESLCSLGNLYKTVGDEREAVDCFLQCLEIARQHEVNNILVKVLLSLGTLYSEGKQYQEALHYLNEGLEAAQSVGLRSSLFELHRALSGVYKQLGDYRQALEHFEQFYAVQQSVFNERSDQRLKTLQIRYEVEDVRSESERYVRKNQELQREVERQREIQANLQRLAETDALTGLLNRRAFLERTQALLNTASVLPAQIAIVMADVDRFKSINDTYGHPAGDDVIRTIGQRIRNLIHEPDIVARMGGEEFIVLIAHKGPLKAKTTAEAIRKAISTQPISTSQGELTVTISVGVAICERTLGRKLDTLIESADKALYSAKMKGRNRTEIQTLTE